MIKYAAGMIVKNVVPLERENGDIVPVGTKLKIVAITPKVRIITINDGYYDNSPYFFNAVPLDQEDKNRIRANFCTIKKEG
jgi:hypothetical protein